MKVADKVTRKIYGTNEIEGTVTPTVKPGKGGTFVTENGIAFREVSFR